MEAKEIAERARRLAVMVRVRGPDPKGLKMKGQAFHLRENGVTTLSLSGLLLPPSLAESISFFSSLSGDGDAIVVTIASALESFLSAKQRFSLGQQEDAPELIPGTAIDVLLDTRDSDTVEWRQAQLLSIADISEPSATLKSLARNQSGSTDYGSWQLGWILGAADNILQNSEVENSFLPEVGRHESSMLIKVAFLRVRGLNLKNTFPVNVSQEQRQGDGLLAMGSPFGILSPSHFLNSVSIGAVANVGSQNACPSLVVADIRCLPGMEGGPVFGQDKSLIGILSKPLRQIDSNAEIQIIIPWNSICASCRDLNTNTDVVIKNPRNVTNERSVSSLKKVASSIVLITVGDQAWGSGILINELGLVLTNAHLLEPWRFRRRSSLTSQKEKNGIFSSQLKQKSTNNVDYVIKDLLFGADYKGSKRLMVRLNLEAPFIWSDARVVYISQGPLDIALLQLESVPQGLRAIDPDFLCPDQGSRVHAIGHGPFGPQSEVSPFYSSGVVTKVVRSKSSLLENPTGGETLPVMLQTTAAVYPGMSGGAIISDVDGRMVALITSNVRHAGGATFPHLNFSLPCAALKPVFLFAENMADKCVLDKLDKHDGLVSSIWALVPPPEPTPRSPSLLEDSKVNDGKGARFAKFLSERRGGEVKDELIPFLRGKISRNLPSKL